MTSYFVYVDDDLKELIPGFFENRYEEINQIKELFSQKDFNTIKKIGHSIKGVGGGYGFNYISELGLQIEEAARQEDEGKLSEIIKNYEEYLNNVEVIYQ